MITVAILINGQPIMARSAHRILGKEDEQCIYACDDGSKIMHIPTDGAIKLAIKMLKTIKE